MAAIHCLQGVPVEGNDAAVHESFDRLFTKLGDVGVDEALKVKAGLEKITTLHYTKRSLGQLSAACKWAMKHGILAQNPYEGMANEMPKHAYQLDPKPNAFTEAEAGDSGVCQRCAARVYLPALCLDRDFSVLHGLSAFGGDDLRSVIDQRLAVEACVGGV